MSQESIEVTVARLDERFKGFQEAFSEMASDMRRMTDSYEELVKSNQRVSILESEMLSLKKSNETLWTKLNAHVDGHASTNSSMLFGILKVAGLFLAGLVAAKFGVTLP